MKAYVVTTRRGDNGCDVVWAENANQAKTMAQACDCCEGEPYTEIRVNRINCLDNMENKIPFGASAWQSEEIRKILVREHSWSCLEPTADECHVCCARQWCDSCVSKVGE